MTTDDVHHELLGIEIPEAEARTCLERAEFGVLGLTKEGEAYTFPVSFGFDTDVTTLYFLFAFDSDSKKREFIETTETASFTVVESELPDEWTSIILTGTLVEIPDTETTAYRKLAETADFPALHTFGDYYNLETVEQSLYRFDVKTKTARCSPGETE